MKIVLFSVVFVVCLFFNVSAQISIDKRNAKLEEVLNCIPMQSAYSYFISSDSCQPENLVTVKFKNLSIEDALKKILENQPYTYLIEGTHIFIFCKQKVTGASRNDIPNATILQGNVKDINGVPIPGATIRLKTDGKKATSTDRYGDFSLPGVPALGTIIISYIGYDSIVFNYSPGCNLKFHLKEKPDQLGEFETIGYQNTPSKLKTGSIHTFKVATVTKPPVNDFTLAIQGKMPGVSVTQSSGLPGAATKVVIRGLESIANGNTPLYIVNGVPWNGNPLTQVANATLYRSPFTGIRFEDIESITILKDADATAIYGSRGANGVILITTKKPVSDYFKVEITRYESYGWVANEIPLMTSGQYVQMRREGLMNDRNAPGLFAADTSWGTGRSIDWQKALLGGTAHTKDWNATITGGRKHLQYLLSVGNRSETTVFPGQNSDKTDFGRAVLVYKSKNKKLNANVNGSYTSNFSNLPQTDLAKFIYMAPNAPYPYDTDGTLNRKYGSFTQPMGVLLQRSEGSTRIFMTSSTLSYDLPFGIQAKVNLGYTKTSLREVAMTPLSSIPGAQENDNFLRSNFSSFYGIESSIAEPQLNYSRTFKDNYVGVLIGGSMQQIRQRSYSWKASGFQSDSLISNLANASVLDTDYDDDLYRYLSGFVRLSYRFREKYVANATLRSDGNNKFAADNRFATFTSLGIAWLFSEENFIKNNFSGLTLGKLRASIGTVGNDQLTENQTINTYMIVPGSAGSGQLPSRLANPLCRWETTKKIDLGISFAIKSIFSFDATYYHNRSKNQLLASALPDFSGFESRIDNLKVIIQNDGLEFMLQKTRVSTIGLGWECSFNITFPRNKLVEYPGLGFSYNADKLFEGLPLSAKPLFQYTGIDPQTGIATFEDRDKNGKIDNRDRIAKFFGQKSYSAFGNTFYFKGFMLDIFLQYVRQMGYDNATVGAAGAFRSDGGNQRPELLNNWQKKGDVVFYQKFAANNPAVNDATIKLNQSTASIVGASYFSVKSVSFSWSLPESMIHKLGLQTFRMYVQGQNLWRITQFKGLDPETQSFGVTPPTPLLRTITVGLQIILNNSVINKNNRHR
jgi:TonB-linked SusC/RagA family outer membrane protein